MALTLNEMPTTPAEARALFREGEWTQATNGICNGNTNANLVIVPEDMACDFLLFAQRNPRPCSVLEVLDAGDPIVKALADGADIRTDLPRYRVFVRGETVEEPTDISEYWRDDLVTFLFGCSGTFSAALENAGIHVRRGRDGESIGYGMYITNIPDRASGTPPGRAYSSQHASGSRRPGYPRGAGDLTVPHTPWWPVARGRTGCDRHR